MSKNVCGIVILFNPVLEELLDNLKLISSQVDEVVLIDNSERNFSDEIGKRCFGRFDYMYMHHKNQDGIAGAQNRGLQYAEKAGFSFVILFDQDSRPMDSLVETLHSSFLRLERFGEQVAVIGPQAINIQSNEVYKPRLQKLVSHQNIDNIEIHRQIISSGSLFRTSIFKKVGYMDASLFIDGVDHEWCWRAEKYGYKTFVSSKSKMYHMLGEGDQRFLGFKVAITSTFRLYYQYRNYIILLKRSYVPFYWKLNNGIKYFIKLFLYGFFVSPRLINIKNILKGINSGLRS